MTTADAPASPCDDPRRTHRLLSEAALRQRFRAEVVDYLLAVRNELVTRFGEVNTYQRFAAELRRRSPNCRHSKTRDLARRRSEHFNNPAGPPWYTVNEILRYVVPEERRDQCHQRFVELYTKARDKPPPGKDDHASGKPSMSPQDAWVLETTRLQAELAIRTQELWECQADLSRTRRICAESARRETALRVEMIRQSHEIHTLRLELRSPKPDPWLGTTLWGLDPRRPDERRRDPDDQPDNMAESFAFRVPPLFDKRDEPSPHLASDPVGPVTEPPPRPTPTVHDPTTPRKASGPVAPADSSASQPSPRGYIGHHRRTRQHIATVPGSALR